VVRRFLPQTYIFAYLYSFTCFFRTVGFAGVGVSARVGCS
jgi:hypothetical protein